MNYRETPIDAGQLAAINVRADDLARKHKLGAYYDGHKATDKMIHELWVDIAAALDGLGVVHSALDCKIARCAGHCPHVIPTDEKWTSSIGNRWHTTIHEGGKVGGIWAQTPQEAALDVAMYHGPVVTVYDDEAGEYSNQLFRDQQTAERAEAKAAARAEHTGQVALW